MPRWMVSITSHPLSSAKESDASRATRHPTCSVTTAGESPCPQVSQPRSGRSFAPATWTLCRAMALICQATKKSKCGLRKFTRASKTVACPVTKLGRQIVWRSSSSGWTKARHLEPPTRGAYHHSVSRAEAIWLRILSIILILLGLALLASPQIPYTTREEIPHTPLSVKRDKVITVPRPVAVLIVTAGGAALIFASRSSESQP
jgi:hypothetical protein